MKRIVSLFLIAVMLLTAVSGLAVHAVEVSVWDGSIDTSWYNEEDTVFALKNAEEFAGFAQLVTNGNNFYGKTVTLEKDINLNSIQWSGIGKSGKPFAGTFDGKSHTVSNVYYNSASAVTGYGLFRYVGNGCEIDHLTIDGFVLSSAAGSSTQLGSLIGGTTVDSNALYIHVNSCAVKNATFNVNSATRIGGLVGYLVLGKSDTELTQMGCAYFTDCHTENIRIEAFGTQDASGNVISGGSLWRGTGMIGQVYKSTPICFTGCTVTHFTDIAHGFSLAQCAGFASCGSFDIEDCTVTDVSFIGLQGASGIGGFITVMDLLSTIRNCHAIGVSVDTGTSEEYYSGVIGGFCGNSQGAASKDDKGIFEDCTATGVTIRVTGHGGGEGAPVNMNGSYIGGFIGTAGGDSMAFIRCSAEGTIDASSYYFGVASQPEGLLPYNAVGGFTGAIGSQNYPGYSTTFQDCSAAVDVVAREAAGGFTGIATMSAQQYDLYPSCTYFEGCSATGNVTSLTGEAGGFCGRADRGSFSDCSAGGIVSSANKAGSFFGAVISNGLGEALMAENCVSDSRVYIDGVEVESSDLTMSAEGNVIFLKAMEIPEGTYLVSGSSSIPTDNYNWWAILPDDEAKQNSSAIYVNREIDGKNGNPKGMIRYISPADMTIAPDTAALAAELDEDSEILDIIGLDFLLSDYNLNIEIENAVLSQEVTVYVPYEKTVVGRTYRVYHWNGADFDGPIDAEVVLDNGKYYLKFASACFSPFVIVGSKSVTILPSGTEVTYTGMGTEAYTVTVPATLAPGATGTVSLSGTWASNREVIITADSSVVLENAENAGETVTLTVSFEDVCVPGNNNVAVSFEQSVSVANAESILFGTWSGAFSYTINIQDVN